MERDSIEILGTQRGDSDVDVFVLEDPKADRRALLRQLAEAGLLLGREVNTLRYTEQSLAERLGDPSHAGAAFVREVLTGPKRWVAGSPAPLVPLVTAAGFSLQRWRRRADEPGVGSSLGLFVRVARQWVAWLHPAHACHRAASGTCLLRSRVGGSLEEGR